MTRAIDYEVQLLQDRFELLRLRTLMVGTLGMLGLVVGLVALTGYGSHAVKLVVEGLASTTEGFHVPANLFQPSKDESWARTPVLLQLAFAVIGVGGVVQMSRQVLTTLEIRLWFAVLLALAAGIIYMQSDIGSVWHAAQRELVNAVRAKEWARVEQLSATSHNSAAHAYVMAQVGLAKPDPVLLQLHGKVLVDQIDDMLLHRQSLDNSLLLAADEFKPEVLSGIDVAVYGAPHTEIGLRLAKSVSTDTGATSKRGGALVLKLLRTSMSAVGLGVAGALLLLWKRMTSRLHRLRPWLMPLE